MIPCRESADRQDDEKPGVVVLGIGNVLRRDEGAGVHAVRRLARELGTLPGVACIDGGTLGVALARDLERGDALIVLDAADMDGAPGSVVTLEGERMDLFLGAPGARSAHGAGLRDLLAVAALAGRLPERRALIGIQAQCLDWGTCPSAPVEHAVATACERARNLIQRWR
jgi:hydrogenase maturation protease